ncbi:unnamed protein product, partial [marine sediment metagenome]
MGNAGKLVGRVGWIVAAGAVVVAVMLSGKVRRLEGELERTQTALEAQERLVAKFEPRRAATEEAAPAPGRPGETPEASPEAATALEQGHAEVVDEGAVAVSPPDEVQAEVADKEAVTDAEAGED